MQLRLPHVLDTSVALIVEGYQSLGHGLVDGVGDSAGGGTNEGA